MKEVPFCRILGETYAPSSPRGCMFHSCTLLTSITNILLCINVTQKNRSILTWVVSRIGCHCRVNLSPLRFFAVIVFMFHLALVRRLLHRGVCFAGAVFFSGVAEMFTSASEIYLYCSLRFLGATHLCRMILPKEPPLLDTARVLVITVVFFTQDFQRRAFTTLAVVSPIIVTITGDEKLLSERCYT
ncbi:hypothetical protein GGR57DRAFT_409143 [Xylariaceae sp. FL1272]|nr:hypothetical protein GGR57DRAFT_409143 [Xylariaceae sp. FL1272]